MQYLVTMRAKVLNQLQMEGRRKFPRFRQLEVSHGGRFTAHLVNLCCEAAEIPLLQSHRRKGSVSMV